MAKPTMWTRTHKELNEDAAASGPNLLVLLDGATPLEPSAAAHRNTHEFVEFVAHELAAQGPRPEGVRDAVVDTLARAPRDRGVTATLTLCAWDDAEVEVLLLADSPCLVATDTGIHVLEDDRFSDHEAVLLEAVERELRHGVAAEDAYRRSHQAQLDARANRNTGQPGSQWVISDSTDPAVLGGQLVRHRFSRSEVASVAIVSDGAWAAVQTFGLTTPADLLERTLIGAPSLAPLFHQVDQKEAADRARTRFPRFSPGDDVTTIATTLRP